MTHATFSRIVTVACAIWLVATIGLFGVLSNWTNIGPETMSHATHAALIGSTALLLMPASTAVVGMFSRHDDLRRHLLIGAALCVCAGTLHQFLWFRIASFGCLVIAVVAARKVMGSTDKRMAAPYAIAAVTALVLPFVALTSWYVFTGAIPEFLGALLDASGKAYGVAEGTIRLSKDRMVAMLALGEPLSFAIVGIVWNAGALVLISFHARFSRPRV
jgi:hypothetical protein